MSSSGDVTDREAESVMCLASGHGITFTIVSSNRKLDHTFPDVPYISLAKGHRNSLLLCFTEGFNVQKPRSGD